MPVIMLLVLLGLIGLVAWGIITIIPMPEPIKNIIVVVAIVICVFVVLQSFGMMPTGVPHIR